MTFTPTPLGPLDLPSRWPLSLAASTGDVTAGISNLVTTAWWLLAVGTIVQGSLSPMLLQLFGVTPKGHYPQTNKHEHYRRRGLMGLLTHRSRIASRHTYMKECIDQITQADEHLKAKALRPAPTPRPHFHPGPILRTGCRLKDIFLGENPGPPVVASFTGRVTYIWCSPTDVDHRSINIGLPANRRYWLRWRRPWPPPSAMRTKYRSCTAVTSILRTHKIQVKMNAFGFNTGDAACSLQA